MLVPPLVPVPVPPPPSKLKIKNNLLPCGVGGVVTRLMDHPYNYLTSTTIEEIFLRRMVIFVPGVV